MALTAFCLRINYREAEYYALNLLGIKNGPNGESLCTTTEGKVVLFPTEADARAAAATLGHELSAVPDIPALNCDPVLKWTNNSDSSEHFPAPLDLDCFHGFATCVCVAKRSIPDQARDFFDRESALVQKLAHVSSVIAYTDPKTIEALNGIDPKTIIGNTDMPIFGNDEREKLHKYFRAYVEFIDANITVATCNSVELQRYKPLSDIDLGRQTEK